MTAPVSRHFAAVSEPAGTRQVHYRRAGRGPAVLLLHQSPQSSSEMEPLMGEWGREFTLIAPDSPGYGLSDPLSSDSASMEDFAEATIRFADAIGLQRFGVYGFHTGASIAVTIADRFPDRLTAVAANGLVALDDNEITAILAGYLPRFTPRWDGSHLAWLWARLREQSIFFPWYDRRLAARMDFDVPPPDRLHASAIEFMLAGDHYPVAYRAAFAGHAERRLVRLTVPTLVTAAARDPLASHLERLTGLPACVRVERSADAADALRRCRELLAGNPGDATSSAGGQTARQPAFYVGEPGRQLLVRQLADHNGEPVLMIHAPGSSSARVAGLAANAAPGRPVFAFDLPGHGGSDAVEGPPRDSALELAVDATLRVATSVAPRGVALVGVEDGSAIALEALARIAAKPPSTLIDPPWRQADEVAAWRTLGLPALAPEWHGGHLLACWHLVRDGRLFHPWFRRDRAHIRRVEPRLDDHDIQAEVLDRLRANVHWQALLAAVLSYPLVERLNAISGDVLIAASRDGPFAASARRLAGLSGPVGSLAPARKPGDDGPAAPS